MKMAASSAARSADGSWKEPMHGSGSFADCWFVTSICSPFTTPSFTSPASGSYSGGIFETCSSKEEEADTAKPLRGVEEPCSGEEEVGDSHANIHRVEEAAQMAALLVGHLSAQIDENLRNIDFDRADLVARAAKGGGVWQRFGVAHLRELRRENGAD